MLGAVVGVSFRRVGSLAVGNTDCVGPDPDGDGGRPDPGVVDAASNLGVTRLASSFIDERVGRNLADNGILAGRTSGTSRLHRCKIAPGTDVISMSGILTRSRDGLHGLNSTIDRTMIDRVNLNAMENTTSLFSLVNGMIAKGTTGGSCAGPIDRGVRR